MYSNHFTQRSKELSTVYCGGGYSLFKAFLIVVGKPFLSGCSVMVVVVLMGFFRVVIVG